MLSKGLTLRDVLQFTPLNSWRHGATNPDISVRGDIVYAHQHRIWRVSAQAPLRPILYCEGDVARWSPDGRHLAVVADGLLLITQPGKHSSIRAQMGARVGSQAVSGRVVDFDWSNDGAFLCAVSLNSDHQRAMQSQLWRVDARTGRSRAVAVSESGAIWSSPRWNPTGDLISVRENAYAATMGRIQNHVALVDIRNGDTTFPVGRGARQAMAAEWSPDGRRLAFPFSPHRAPIHIFRFNCGIADVDTGGVRTLANDYYVHAFESVAWSKSGVLCCASRGLSAQIISLPSEGEPIIELTRDPGSYDHIRCQPQLEAFVCTYRSLTALPEVIWMQRDGSRSEQKTSINEPLRNVRLAPAKIVHWTTDDGVQIQGVLIEPRNARVRNRPALVYFHGGPVAGLRAEFHPEWHWLAEQGVTVFLPDFRSSQLYGWYPRADPRRDVADSMAGVHSLIASGSIVEGNVTLMGFSYGAVLAVRALTETEVFRGAVLTGLKLDRSITPANARRRVLILQGELDNPDIVDDRASLADLGLNVELIRYPHEEHVIQLKTHRMDYWRRVLRFLVEPS